MGFEIAALILSGILSITGGALTSRAGAKQAAAQARLQAEQLGIQKQIAFRDYLTTRRQQQLQLPILQAQERRAERMGKVQYQTAQEALSDMRRRKSDIENVRKMFDLSGMAQLGSPTPSRPEFEAFTAATA